MACGQQKDARRSELARIHIGKKELGMDDDTYRDMLFTVARVRSAKDLDRAGRQMVLDHMRGLGFKSKRKAIKKNYPGRPHNIDSEDRGPLLKKIEALLTDAGRKWSYARSMARRMFHVDQLEFCNPEQLHKIVAALEYDAKRREARK